MKLSLPAQGLLTFLSLLLICVLLLTSNPTYINRSQVPKILNHPLEIVKSTQTLKVLNNGTEVDP